jgi:hypothetical protein
VRFSQANCASKPGCVQNPVTAYRATVDPDFHNGNPGTVIASGPISDPNWQPDPGEIVNITFDPAQFPGTGIRKLVLIGTQPTNALGWMSPHEGPQVFWLNDGV